MTEVYFLQGSVEIQVSHNVSGRQNRCLIILPALSLKSPVM